MGKFYRSARRVIVLLGKETEDTELAFQLMDETGYGARLAEALLSAAPKKEKLYCSTAKY